MPTRSHAPRPRFAPVSIGDGAAILGAITCVLAAAILYLCFAALALLDDGDVDLERAPSSRPLVVVRAPSAALTLRA